MSDPRTLPELEQYFQTLIPLHGPVLQAMAAEAALENIPIVGPVVGRLLYLLAKATRSRRILELGTATGYSTLCLAQGCAAVAGTVVSIEQDACLRARAQAWLEQAQLSQRVRVVHADALAWLTQAQPAFDLIFLDIDKADYVRTLPDCERLLAPGGLLIADNTAFADAAGFNQAVFSSSHWESVNFLAYLPQHSLLHDGLCLALRC